MLKRPQTDCAKWLVAGAILGLALSGCASSWNRQERRTVCETLERIQAAAAAQAQSPETLPPPAPKPGAQGEVRLTLLEALRVALSNNQDIQVAGYGPLLAEADIVRARVVYDPSLFLSNEFARTDRPIKSTIDTGSAQGTALIEDTWAFKGGVKQLTPSGGTASVYQEMNYLDSNSRLVLPNPQYASRLNFELTQPLLKGFGDAANQANIRIATLGAGISLYDFRQKVMEVAARVAAAYWQLVFDRESARVSRESLERAREVLRRETVRAGRGVSNELNQARAASVAATREAEVVRAENRVRSSADQVKRLLKSPDLPIHGEAAIVPVDPPRFFLVDVDRTAAITLALSRRPELDRARAVLAGNQIRIDAADRDRLPKLDATLRYTMNGLGTGPGQSMEMQRFSGPFSWVAGLEFEWPLGNRLAEAEHQKRRIEYEQTLLQADQLADQVMQEVNLAARTVLQGRDEVESTLRAQTAARKVVASEYVRYELGDVSNDELLRSHDTLAAAEREHVQALLNFNLALSELKRAQGTFLEDYGIEIVWPEENRSRPLPLSAGLADKNPQPPAAPMPSRPKTP